MKKSIRRGGCGAQNGRKSREGGRLAVLGRGHQKPNGSKKDQIDEKEREVSDYSMKEKIAEELGIKRG